MIVNTVVGGGRYATPTTVHRGTAAEQRFANMCTERGLELRVATKKENVVFHFDFLVTLNDGRRKAVDVKAVKSRRRGERPDPTVVFVEMQGVSGRPGWVFGNSDLIAFEQPNGFFMVPRPALLLRTQQLMQRCRPCCVSGVAMTVYRRKGRMDELVVLSISDISDIEGSFFLKA